MWGYVLQNKMTPNKARLLKMSKLNTLGVLLVVFKALGRPESFTGIKGPCKAELSAA
jgi:hypothetical protein